MLGTPVSVDAQNAPTETWKTAQNAVSPSAHTPYSFVGGERQKRIYDVNTAHTQNS